MKACTLRAVRILADQIRLLYNRPSGARWLVISCAATLLLMTAPAVKAVSFTVQGTNIYKDGVLFVPHGANVDGDNWVWQGDNGACAAKMAAYWKFNIVRVNCFVDPADTSNTTYPQDLNQIINNYTAQGIAVILEPHDWTGAYPTGAALDKLANWHYNLAVTYKNNPYVWFDVMNEPGNNAAPYWSTVDPQWLTVTQRIVSTIRDDAGANNIILCEGAAWGQDACTWDSNPVPASNSAILTYGTQAINFNNKTYPNIAFTIHCYDQWAQGDAKLQDYITRVHNLNLCLIIGEFGAYPDSTTNTMALEANTVFRVAPPAGVGLIWWHYMPWDGFALTTEGGGDYVNSMTAPTDLTWAGQLMWNYSHSFGADPTPHSGSWMAKVIPGTNYHNLFQTANVNQNTNYTISFYLIGTGSIHIRVLKSDWSATLFEGSFSPTSSSSWNQQSLNFNSASNNQVVIDFSDFSSGGILYIDDVVCAASDGVNKVSDGDFEAGSGQSVWSLEAPFYIVDPPIAAPPATPTGLKATAGAAGSKKITLTWQVSTNATSYIIYRGTSAGGESTTAIATGVTGTSWINTGLTARTSYYYKIAAVSSAGISGKSNEASATAQ